MNARSRRRRPPSVSDASSNTTNKMRTDMTIATASKFSNKESNRTLFCFSFLSWLSFLMFDNVRWIGQNERKIRRIGNHWGHRPSGGETILLLPLSFSRLFCLSGSPSNSKKIFSFSIFLGKKKKNIFPTCWMTVNWPENLTGNSAVSSPREREREKAQFPRPFFFNNKKSQYQQPVH